MGGPGTALAAGGGAFSPLAAEGGAFPLAALVALFLLLIFVWQWQIARFDPARRAPSPLQAALGVRWRAWDEMAWEEKMAVYRRYRAVNWGWALATLATFVALCALGMRHALALYRGGVP